MSREPAASPFTTLVEVAETGSTSSDLVAAILADDGAWPHLAALRTEHQVAGRGRAGRTWTTPPGTSATFSVVLRPGRPRAEWATLSLVAGLAVVRALRDLGPVRGAVLDAALKWPNDVVLRTVRADADADAADVPGWGTTRKIAGVLAETVPGRDAVVVGIGINVAQREVADLPVPWATSLALAGVACTPREVAFAVGRELATLTATWEAGGLAALHDVVAAATDTIGRDVAVDLGDGVVLAGRASGIEPDGRLVVVTPDGAAHPVAAGDVVHARRA
ncbi:biotin--[acetyl-CoA-carboxylase] ligase [Serinibacter arcticus]|uniref:biotin--[biotin carboxyl-carrier protein] ligase n=1 Tax=Serinibacter arcticus TaxID=1655435 RepID=A0A4Z1DYU3_9MICO|nr:biotin--[acetyl-CoA-carboxylase] ligase [Serinibacter arcticus]TGO04109.1 Biotin--protein ligase [Serinibacter arcticus]